ncbi:MAG: hypothetical protein CSB06_02870, partial [Bacteroidia bacterium]
NTYTTTGLSDNDLVKVKVWNGNNCYDETTETQMIVNPLPNADFTMDDAEVCNGENATLSLSGSENGVTYQLLNAASNTKVGSPVPGTGSAIDFTFTPSATADYKVVADNGCVVELTDQAKVTVNPLPNDAFTMDDAEVCNGENATLSLSGSENGVTYQLLNAATNTKVGSPVPGTGSAIDFTFTPSATADYKVVADNGCVVKLTDQAKVTVNPLPNDAFTMDDAEVCNGENATLSLSGSENGVTYQLLNAATNTKVGSPVPGTGSAIDVTFTPSATADYKVVADNGCVVELTDQAKVTVNPLPNDAFTMDDAEVCNGENATLSLPGSENGVNYQLLNAATNTKVGSPVPGTGNSIDFTFTPSATADYKVVADNGCVVELTDQAKVTVNPLPNDAFTMDDAEVCNGENATLSLSGSENGVTYQLLNAATNMKVGSPVPGTENSIDFTFTPSATADYKVVADNGCEVELTDQAKVTVNPLPNDAFTMDDAEVCNGENVTLSLSGSENGVNYQLLNAATNTKVGSPVPGTGSAIDFTFTPSATTDYKVVATIVSKGCSVVLSDGSNVRVNELPDIETSSNTQTFCEEDHNLLSDVNISGENIEWYADVDLTSKLSDSGELANETTYYAVSVSDAGCRSRESLPIYILLEDCSIDVLKVPDGFTPNGDGINDRFVIKGLEDYPDNRLMIMNRWGNKVYEQNPYGNKWDGKSNAGLRFGGNDLPEGTYFYILEYKDKTGKHVNKKGYIYLKR